MELTGNVRNRFVQAAVLLRLLDPVRGEATVHGLDQASHEMTIPRERLLKRKFTDSFALICAIRKDGNSVSAACMEEGAPQGTIVRVASNSGVGQRTLDELRELVAVSNRMGSGGTPAAVSTTEISRGTNIALLQSGRGLMWRPKFSSRLYDLTLQRSDTT